MDILDHSLEKLILIFWFLPLHFTYLLGQVGSNFLIILIINFFLLLLALLVYQPDLVWVSTYDLFSSFLLSYTGNLYVLQPFLPQYYHSMLSFSSYPLNSVFWGERYYISIWYGWRIYFYYLNSFRNCYALTRVFGKLSFTSVWSLVKSSSSFPYLF